MKMTKVVNGFKKIQKVTSEHSPVILTVLALVGLAGTTVLTVKATIKAVKDVEEAKQKLLENECTNGDEEYSKKSTDDITLSKKDIVKITWKRYIPVAATGVATMACVAGSDIISKKRINSLAGLYSITNTAFEEYKDKVKQRLGDKEYQAIHDDIAKDHLEKADISESNPVIITGDGDMLCYDTYSGRYFKSNVEKIRKLENQLNSQLIHENYVSLNDVYYALGLPNIKRGNDIGWNANHLIEFAFSSHLKDGEFPVLVIDYIVAPYYDYEKY